MIRISKRQWAVIAAGIIFLFAGSKFLNLSREVDAITFTASYFAGLTGRMMCFVLPVLAVFAGGGLFLEEYESGYIKLHIVRTDRFSYVFRKSFGTLCTGFIDMFLAGMIFFLLYFYVFFLFQAGHKIPPYLLKEAFTAILRLSFLTGLVSGLAGICGAIFLNYYMAYGLPFAGYYFLIILKERYAQESFFWYPPEWVNPMNNWGGADMGLYALFILLADFLFVVYALILSYRLRDIS